MRTSKKSPAKSRERHSHIQFSNLFRRIGSVAFAVAVSAWIAPSGFSDDAVNHSLTRADATHRIEEARRIVRPNGIERNEKVIIGGIEQWISIRGVDRRNPVLLLLHGGPGYVQMPMSWWNARGWEEYFTVVQWDQRGSGKTYLINDPAKVSPTMTFPRMIADTEELITWLRKELGKDKIFVLGHSWGSYLGVEIAHRHPEWLHAYIGVGQISNNPIGEQRGWKLTRDAALKDKNEEAVRQLDSIAPYFTGEREPTLKDIFVERKWLELYGGVMAYRHNNRAESDLEELSPDYTDAEIAHIWDGNSFSEKAMLVDILKLNVAGLRKFDCPFILFLGRHDTNVNSELAAEWFEQVTAPTKELVWFEHSGHMPMTEEQGKFFLSLVRYARPLAERSGDVAP